MNALAAVRAITDRLPRGTVRRLACKVRHLEDRNAELRSEAELLAEALDKVTREAQGYRAEVARLSAALGRVTARCEEQRDQLDDINGVRRDPSLTEQWLAIVAELTRTDTEDPR